MRDDSFQLAAQRARRTYSIGEWISLRPRERSDAIYRELKRIDAGRVADKSCGVAKAADAITTEVSTTEVSHSAA